LKTHNQVLSSLKKIVTQELIHQPSHQRWHTLFLSVIKKIISLYSPAKKEEKHVFMAVFRQKSILSCHAAGTENCIKITLWKVWPLNHVLNQDRVT
jgi:hypothetical protein